MNEQTVRQVVTARFYESLAQSGVEVTAIPQPQLQAIVNALADGVFAALDAMETEADHSIAETNSRSGGPADGEFALTPGERKNDYPRRTPRKHQELQRQKRGGRKRQTSTPAPESSAASAGPLEKEELLWSGRPYLSIGVRYELTNQRVRLIRGLLGRSYHEIELVRVRDTSVTQHLGERALNVGDITITSTDPSHPEFTLHNVKDPMEVREMIRKATMQEKQRRGLHYREEM